MNRAMPVTVIPASTGKRGMSFLEPHNADHSDERPAPVTRQPSSWSVLRITRARDWRKKEQNEAIFIVASGELEDRRPVEIFLNFADPHDPAAVERGLALANALIEAGGVNSSREPQRADNFRRKRGAPLLFALVQQLNTLPPVEVSGALVERHGTFIPRLEIEAVRPAQTRASAERPI
jgi:hypothetical protein